MRESLDVLMERVDTLSAMVREATGGIAANRGQVSALDRRLQELTGQGSDKTAADLAALRGELDALRGFVADQPSRPGPMAEASSDPLRETITRTGEPDRHARRGRPLDGGKDGGRAEQAIRARRRTCRAGGARRGAVQRDPEAARGRCAPGRAGAQRAAGSAARRRARGPRHRQSGRSRRPRQLPCRDGDGDGRPGCSHRRRAIDVPAAELRGADEARAPQPGGACPHGGRPPLDARGPRDGQGEARSRSHAVRPDEQPPQLGRGPRHARRHAVRHRQ